MSGALPDRAAPAILTSDIAGFESAFLALEERASAAHSRFVFDAREDALALRRFLLERRAAEYSPPAGRLLLIDREPAGMIAVLDAAALRGSRLRAARLLSRALPFALDPGVTRRLQLATRTLRRVQDDEVYLSRVAVADRFAGCGYGRWLLDQAVAEARSRGARALVLDVADDNDRAIAVYQRYGFTEIGRESASDAESGRRLCHLHLSRPCTS